MSDANLATLFYMLKGACDNLCASVQNEAPKEVLKSQFEDAARNMDAVMLNVWNQLDKLED